MFGRTQAPDVVVFPQSTEQVSQVARVCSALAIPMIPHGTGTGMEGGTVCTQVNYFMVLTPLY